MILCCGEALIDMIPSQTELNDPGYVPHVGGSVYNTAIALGRLGIPVSKITGLSRDLFGQQLIAGLRESGVDTSMILMSDRPTTLAFVQLDGGQASYTFYDENSAGRCLGASDMPAVPVSTTALFFGGISLCSEPGADAYLALAEKAAPKHTIMLDPNVRPGFVKNEASYRARLNRMVALADIIKVSSEDLEWIFPGPETTNEKISNLLDMGPAFVVLTQGGEGAVVFAHDGSHIVVPAVEAVVADTVAAGDTFNAALLAWLDMHGGLNKSTIGSLPIDTLQAALDFAAKAAAITVSRTGANPPWKRELEQA